MSGNKDENRLISDIAKASEKAARKSMQQRTLKAILASHVSGEMLFEIIHNGQCDCKNRGTENAINLKRADDARKRRQKGIEEMAARSNVTGTGNEQCEVELADSLTKRGRLNGGFSRALSASRKDWLTLIRKGTFTPIVNTRKCISDDYLKVVVKFILRDDHVQLLSWGSRRLKCNGKWKVFPDIIRKVSKETIS